MRAIVIPAKPVYKRGDPAPITPGGSAVDASFPEFKALQESNRWLK
jgi:hypothetical protein